MLLMVLLENPHSLIYRRLLQYNPKVTKMEKAAAKEGAATANSNPETIQTQIDIVVEN